MRTLLSPTAGSGAEGGVDLGAHYAVPAVGVRSVRVNFVASADGAATAGGKSEGLSSAADKEVFRTLRGLADVVLVGAGTARAEGYGPVRTTTSGRRPPIAVVTGHPDLEPASALFTAAQQRTILLTTDEADTAAYDAVADVVRCGPEHVDIARALDALAERGLTRVLCEGGPTLLGQLSAADAVDELCLTVAPLLAGPGGPRITAGDAHPPRAMRLVGLLEDEGSLLSRYARIRDAGPDPATA